MAKILVIGAGVIGGFPKSAKLCALRIQPYLFLMPVFFIGLDFGIGY